MTIGERIKQRRIELNMSQDELAKKVGYKSRSSIQKIESARNLPITKVEKMAYALDTTPAYLMGWQEQVERVQEQLEPYTKQIAEFGKQINKSLGLDGVEVNKAKLNEAKIIAIFNKYSEKEIERALQFVKAFLEANPERQKIALEILQSHQADS